MQDTILLKIKALVKKADKFDSMQFRLLLEDLLKQGGHEAENLIAHLATSEELDSLTRINIIRIMGYVQSIAFLIPLRKTLEANENLNLRKAAIISISKYNDKRALNMLNSALQRINNPILRENISSEISRIKNDNPILGLMPKFLNAVDDPKTFRTTLEVLKQVLSPTDAHQFIYHLKSEIPFVGDGAFEILCCRGDESVQFSIFDYFRLKLKDVSNYGDVENVSLQYLLAQLDHFITRNPQTINYVLKELKDIYKIVADPLVRDLIIHMFSASPKREVLAFLEEVYNKDESRRDLVIEKLMGNEAGAYILLYKFKNDDSRREKLTLALTSTQAGGQFLTENFDTLSPGHQKLVLNNIGMENYRFFSSLIERFLLSDDFSHKKFALDKMRQNCDFQFHSILFDPKQEPAFLRLHSEYVAAISQLYPVKAFNYFISRVIHLDNCRGLMKHYYSETNEFLSAEAVIKIPSQEIASKFIDRLAKFNNKDISLEALNPFYYIKTFDQNTLVYIQNMLDEYRTLRESRISPEEKGLLNKIASNLLTINGDLKKIQGAQNNISRFMEKDFPDLELLDYLLKTHIMSFFVHRNMLLERLRKTFKLPRDLDAYDVIKYLMKRPRLSIYFREEIAKSCNSSNYLLKQDAEKLQAAMPKSQRIVLFFAEPQYYSYLKDQLQELIPEAEVVFGGVVEPDDFLIADFASMESLRSENRINTKKLYVLLKDPGQFQEIKDFRPKAFPPPFSLYRIMKVLISDMFYESEPESLGTTVEEQA